MYFLSQDSLSNYLIYDAAFGAILLVHSGFILMRFVQHIS